MFWCRIDSR